MTKNLLAGSGGSLIMLHVPAEPCCVELTYRSVHRLILYESNMGRQCGYFSYLPLFFTRCKHSAGGSAEKVVKLWMGRNSQS